MQKRSIEYIDTMHGGIFEVQYEFKGKEKEVDLVCKKSRVLMHVFCNNTFGVKLVSVRLVAAPRMHGNTFKHGGDAWPVFSDPKRNMKIEHVNTESEYQYTFCLGNMPLSYHYRGNAMQVEIELSYAHSRSIVLRTRPFKVVHMK